MAIIAPMKRMGTNAKLKAAIAIAPKIQKPVKLKIHPKILPQRRKQRPVSFMRNPSTKIKRISVINFFHLLCGKYAKKSVTQTTRSKSACLRIP